MASISTRTTVVAVMEEVTENTPVAPGAATDYIAIQDDFAMAPNYESLENAEIRSSIGMSKAIQGAESPTVTISHYLRASGSVATAPNFGKLIESCLGAVTTAAAEYDTVSSSTTSLLKVNTGEGASYQRGEGLLVKDSTNGYRIRCIDSISSDDLTIGFALPNAPASGVNLGRAVLYYPSNTSQPTLTVWDYHGNGGAIQMISGCRVTEMSFSIEAGELINGTYSLEGLAYYFNPITIASSDRYLDFTDDDGTFAATVTAGVYKDPHKLAEAITTAMNTANAGQVHTCTYSNSTGKFTILSDGTLLSLLWQSGSNTANTIGDKLGFTVSADDTGTAAATGYASDNAVSFASPYTPSLDSQDPAVAKDNEVMIGDTSDYTCFKASTCDITVSAPKADTMSVCSESGKSGSIVSSREITITVQALIEQYDARMWKAYRANDNVKFQYSFGSKSGGNWVAGQCGAIYCPTMTVSSFEIVDADGQANLTMELKGYVNTSGEGEIFVNFL